MPTLYVKIAIQLIRSICRCSFVINFVIMPIYVFIVLVKGRGDKTCEIHMEKEPGNVPLMFLPPSSFPVGHYSDYTVGGAKNVVLLQNSSCCIAGLPMSLGTHAHNDSVRNGRQYSSHNARNV